MTKYIVIFQQVIGGNGRPFTISYSWDTDVFSQRRSAIRHGFKTRGSDDFNIGVLRDGKLNQFCWMHKALDHDIEEIAEQIGIEAKR